MRNSERTIYILEFLHQPTTNDFDVFGRYIIVMDPEQRSTSQLRERVFITWYHAIIPWVQALRFSANARNARPTIELLVHPVKLVL